MDYTQEEILKTDDLNRLYEILLDIKADISLTHKEVQTAETIIEKTEAQGELTILYSLAEIANLRINDLREKIKMDNNEAQRLNYNFRMASKSVLSKDIYNQIMDLAHKSRREVKSLPKMHKS